MSASAKHSKLKQKTMHEQTFNLKEWSERTHRPETTALLLELAGHEMGEAAFILKYKALGLTRMSPAKGRGLYRFLVRKGIIRSNNR